MIQRRRRFSLAAKTLQRRRIGNRVFGEKLQRDTTVQARIFRFVNYAHAAATQPRHDAVVRNGLADH